MSAEGWILVLLRCGQLDKLDWSWRYHRCWAGLGWVSGTAATESREKNAMNSYSQTPPSPAPPRPALQSAALTHFQQETSHGCSLTAAGDVTSPGSGSGEECKVRGGADQVTQCRARTLSRLLTCT